MHIFQTTFIYRNKRWLNAAGIALELGYAPRSLLRVEIMQQVSILG